MRSSPLASMPVDNKKIKFLEGKSIQLRKTLLKIIYTANAGHTGGSLSCVDILNVLYNHVMNICPENFSEINRDHYIHSKGHSVEVLYAVLADKGFYQLDALDSVEKYGSDFIGHPTRSVPGEVSMRELDSNKLACNPTATVNGFIVEPGSKMSIMTIRPPQQGHGCASTGGASASGASASSVSV